MSEPYYSDATITLHHGDCLDVLRSLPDASVDAVVTDPPYGLEFMGKEWDAPWKADGTVLSDPASVGGFQDGNGGNPYSRSRVRFGIGVGFQQWCQIWAAECLRVLKPGGHMLAFGGTRTWHRLACAIEDAGFEIRDSIAWLYGSGFPKSLDVSKAIDKAARGVPQGGADPTSPNHGNYRTTTTEGKRWDGDSGQGYGAGGSRFLADGMASGSGMEPAASGVAAIAGEAEQWQGWGTALKPAHEPIVVARKPLASTVAANVLAHGTGALNIDACRLPVSPDDEINTAVWTSRPSTIRPGTQGFVTSNEDGERSKPREPGLGRWPANVVLDASQAAALDEQSGELSHNPPAKWRSGNDGSREGFMGAIDGREAGDVRSGFGDTGGASRFFYVAREDVDSPPPREWKPCWRGECRRECYYPETCTEGSWETRAPQVPLNELGSRFTYVAKADASERVRVNGTAHPTVKPLALMRWLVRLVTPPGGTVLEPFAGSGTTVEACILEGFSCIAIEREADYLPLIRQRIHRRRDPVEAVKATGDDGGLFDLLGGASA